MRNLYRITIVLLICFIFSPAQSQISIYDSLQREYEKLSNKNTIDADTLKVILLNDIGWELMYSNPDTAIIITTNALQISKKRKWKKGIASSYGSLGSYYYLKSEYPKALEFYFKSLKINEEMGNKSRVANMYNNIGIVYKEQSDYKKALKYYEKSLAIQKELGKKNGIANAMNNIGSIYSKNNDYDKALKYYGDAAKLFEEVDNRIGLGTSLNNLGVIYEELNQKEKALEYYFKSLAIDKELENRNGEAMTLGNIGLLYTSMKKYSQAEKYLIESHDISEEIGSVDLLQEVEGYLANFYEATSKPSLALKYYKSFIKLRDSILNEENLKASLQKEIAFNYEKKASIDSVAYAKEKEIKNAEIEKKNAELEKTNIEINAKKTQEKYLYVGLSLVLIFSFFIYNRFKVTKKQNVIIESQKREVEIQKEEAEHQRHLVEEKNKEITDSINYAKRIQDAILPSRESLTNNLRNGFVLYKPKDIVAGDFYWLEKMNGSVYLAAADCTGHGVPGALVSVICSNALSKSLLEEGIENPGKILDRTRELVINKFSKSGADVKDGMDISLCKFNFTDNEKVELLWAGANNPLWIIRNNSTIVEEIKADKQPIGKYSEATPFKTHSLNLNTGDTIYIFTDGYADQFGGPQGKKFKAANLKSLLLSIQGKDMNSQKDIINNEFENWRGELEQIDDVCLIGIKI